MFVIIFSFLFRKTALPVVQKIKVRMHIQSIGLLLSCGVTENDAKNRAKYRQIIRFSDAQWEQQKEEDCIRLLFIDIG